MRVRVAIIGTGFSGLCMAIQLKLSGEHDLVLLERADAIGGTWRDNTYPGCACDVPAHVYSFSFDLNPGWSRTYAPQPEIRAYLERCADKFDVRRHVRFRSAVREARFDELTRRWHIQTQQGAHYEADFLVSGIGGLSNAYIPPFPGRDTFTGPQFHTSTWDHSVDLTGKRVAVVGTGASAIQVVPAIAQQVAQLSLFQRTPPWVLPRLERYYRDGLKDFFSHNPTTLRLFRGFLYRMLESVTPTLIEYREHPRGTRLLEYLGRHNLERSITDPALRKRLTPTYAPGCKRLLMSNDYYPALARNHVRVLTDGIARITADGIQTQDGQQVAADVIVYGTGFAVHDYLAGMKIYGRDGRELGDLWSRSPTAYLGTLTAHFPNLFFLTGPNTGLGSNSLVVVIEAQVGLVMDCLRLTRERGAQSIEVRPDVQQQYNDELQERLGHTVWNSGGCRSWYLNEQGRNSTLWPGTTVEFRRRTAHARPADYVFAR